MLSEFPVHRTQLVYSPYVCIYIHFTFLLPFLPYALLWGTNLGEAGKECVLTTLPNTESYLFAAHGSVYSLTHSIPPLFLQKGD